MHTRGSREKETGLVLNICFAFLIWWILDLFVIEAAVVNGDSMYPTLRNNDFLFIRKIMYEPVAGDIVIIKSTDMNIGEKYILKRIIALGGQTVDIDYQSNVICVDGTCIVEPYINYENNDPMVVPEDYQGSHFTVPEGSFFVLGDNRNLSLDSRSKVVGMIESEDIIGTVWFYFRLPVLYSAREAGHTIRLEIKGVILGDKVNG